ncbi:uncharacterized protein LOC117191698 [Drosophila miranda]|uniref:uncharacterized protein LOC117191698 n=1 Tax=Drosophila miranda TaxID=7229 RepID=UPI00143F7E99|nr:uncharacterized protein LOC117191698 [Drosophila miranda]
MHFTKTRSCRSTMPLMLLLIVLTAGAWCASSSKPLEKRSLALDVYPEASIPWAITSGPRALNGGPWNLGWPTWSGGHTSLGIGPTPNEVAHAISVAKQASANVLIAQQHLQAAKENVLNQQRIATERQTQAVILKQKSQAAAAIQRSEAIQQRLAASKAAVAHAAAHAAAAEIQKTEHEAAKLGHFTRNAHPGVGNPLPTIGSGNNNFSPSNVETIGFGHWLSGSTAGKSVNNWY